MDERTPALANRRVELNELRRFATSGERFRWLVGIPWAGKTALMAKFFWAPPAEVDIIGYFLQSRAADADALHFMSAAVAQLAWLLDEDAPAVPDRHVLADLWQRASTRAELLDRHLLLMVDGLDEDLRPRGQPSIAAVLPTHMGERTHVLIASRFNPPLPDDVDADHPLRMTHPTVLEQAPEARNIEQAAQHELNRLLTSAQQPIDQPMMAQQILGVLTAAQGALSVDDLADLTHRPVFDIERFVQRHSGRVLEPVGSPPRYQFAHQTLLERSRRHFFTDRRLPPYQDALASWAQQWADEGWPHDSPEYLLRDYPGILAQQDSEASSLVNQPGWLEIAIRRLGIDEVLRAVASFPGGGSSIAQTRRLLGIAAPYLRPPYLIDQHEYIARQLCLAAVCSDSASDTVRQWHQRIFARPGPQLAATAANRITRSTLLRILGRHNSGIDALAISIDGRWVASSDAFEGVLKVFDLEGQGPPRELGEVGTVDMLAFAPNGSSLFSFSADGTIERWDTQESIIRCELGRGSSGAAISPDRRWMITGTRDGLYRVWDLTGQQPPRNVGQHRAGDQRPSIRGGGPVALAFTPDARSAVSGGGDGTVWVRDLTDAQKSRLVGRHNNWITTVAVSPNGRWIATGGRDRAVKIWDLTGEQPELQLTGHRTTVTEVAFTPDGRSLISGDHDGNILVHDTAESWSTMHELGHHPKGVSAMVVTPDGTGVITGGGDGTLREWDLSFGPGKAEVHQVKAAPTTRIGPRDALAFSPDLRSLASGNLDREVRVTTVGSEQPEQELGRHTNPVWAVAFSPDGQQVASGGADGAIWLGDATGRESPRELGTHSGGVSALAYSPDGRFLVSAGRSCVLLWNLLGQHQPRYLCDSTEWVEAVTFSSDCEWVIGGDTGLVFAWNIMREGDQRVFDIPDSFGLPRAVAAAPNGRWVVAGGCEDDDRKVYIFDFAARRLTCEICLDSEVLALSVSPGSQWVIAGTDNGVYLIDVYTGEQHLQAWVEGIAALAVRCDRSTPVEVLLATASASLGVVTWKLSLPPTAASPSS
ncbi:WD40 repeat domain-containing protein [Nonomuraea sp. NPDC049129]|uniref:WD40 repeat domain-containing protein n=1 Tax=Nonomuraea sp. NPDC049129 TaxID=3155272 RepID=UPI0033F51D79